MGRGGLERGSSVHYNNVNYSQTGALRRLADQIAGNRWCLNRVWVVAVTVTSLLAMASMSPMGTSIQATILHPRQLVTMHAYTQEFGSEQLVWQHRTEQMISYTVSNSIRHNAAAAEHYQRLLKNPIEKAAPASTDESEPFENKDLDSDTAPVPYIEDVVALPEEQDLFLVRHARNDDDSETRISACRYGEKLKSDPSIVNFLPDGRLAVICTRPSGLASSTEKGSKLEHVSLEVNDGESSPFLPNATQEEFVEPARWDTALVYAVQSTEEDVVLYVKGIFDSQRRKAEEYTELKNFRCVFGHSVETPVTVAALEVYRCEHPSNLDFQTQSSARVKVHMLYKGNPIPSVAYYQAPDQPHSTTGKKYELGGESEQIMETGSNYSQVVSKKKHLVCSCTMIWNVAKFLREWVVFNSALGVEKFFLYDNNSEDDIESVVSSLAHFNVTRTNWPWVKTQEAGFSHCAIEAQRECAWVLFTDVDEYLFPKRWLNISGPGAATSPPAGRATSPLASLIEDSLKRVTLPANSKAAVAARTGAAAAVSNSSAGAFLPPPHVLQVGQISFHCRNFGPSGLTTNPSEGVTQGYTCRDQKEQRHKSLVYFPALKRSLQNVIHHFYLEPQYQTLYLDVRQAVVNHYKFQAWSEFATKFTKRASTYVADWREPKNLGSRDRPDGVGPEATKPPDWESRHCDMNDTALRDWTRQRFGVLGSGDSGTMVWEL